MEGAKVHSHRTVTLLVEAGRVKVPDFTGQTLLEAQTRLADNNLALGAVTGLPFRVESKTGSSLQSRSGPETVSDWSSKGLLVPVGTAIDLAFPGGYELVHDRVISSLASSEIVRTIGNGLVSTGKTYPTIDRLTSLELLANLLPPGIVARPAPRLNLAPIYPRGIKTTQTFEGWVDHLYNDAANYCTIGYGHLIKRARCDGTERYQNGLTQAEGTKLLEDDLYSAHATVLDAVKVKMTDGQVAALTDFVFNVGGASFRKSTLLQVVNTNNHYGVPVQFRRWVIAGGKPWPGLKARREGEIDLFFDGIPRIMAREGPSSEPPPALIDIQMGERR